MPEEAAYNPVFPCGGPGQQACKPVTAITVAHIVAAYQALSQDEIAAAHLELAAEEVDESE